MSKEYRALPMLEQLRDRQFQQKIDARVEKMHLIGSNIAVTGGLLGGVGLTMGVYYGELATGENFEAIRTFYQQSVENRFLGMGVTATVMGGFTKAVELVITKYFKDDWEINRDNLMSNERLADRKFLPFVEDFKSVVENGPWYGNHRHAKLTQLNESHREALQLERMVLDLAEKNYSSVEGIRRDLTSRAAKSLAHEKIYATIGKADISDLEKMRYEFREDAMKDLIYFRIGSDAALSRDFNTALGASLDIQNSQMKKALKYVTAEAAYDAATYDLASRLLAEIGNNKKALKVAELDREQKRADSLRKANNSKTRAEHFLTYEK